MDESELKRTAELYKAYCAAFAEISNAVKDRKNPHLGNDYATLESVLAAVRPVFARHGLAVYQAPAEMAVLEPGVYVVSVITVLMHASGQNISVRTQVPVVPQVDKKTGASRGVDAQRTGSAITYARRYALAAVAGITQTDDDGEAAAAPAYSAGESKELLDAVLRAQDATSLTALRDAVRASGDRKTIAAYVERKRELEGDA